MEFSRSEYWSGWLFPSPGGYSQPRDWTQVSRIAGRFFIVWATREADWWHPPKTDMTQASMSTAQPRAQTCSCWWMTFTIKPWKDVEETSMHILLKLHLPDLILFHKEFSGFQWISQLVQSVQSLSHVQLFATPWITAHQASLSITNSQSLFKLMSIKSVMPSSHLILCRPLLLLTPIPPSIRVFSNESALRMRWPKYWSFSFSISPSNEHPGLISLQSKGLSSIFSNTTVQKHQFFGAQLSSQSNSHIHTWPPITTLHFSFSIWVLHGIFRKPVTIQEKLTFKTLEYSSFGWKWMDTTYRGLKTKYIYFFRPFLSFIFIDKEEFCHWFHKQFSGSISSLYFLSPNPEIIQETLIVQFNSLKCRIPHFVPSGDNISCLTIKKK